MRAIREHCQGDDKQLEGDDREEIKQRISTCVNGKEAPWEVKIEGVLNDECTIECKPKARTFTIQYKGDEQGAELQTVFRDQWAKEYH